MKLLWLIVVVIGMVMLFISLFLFIQRNHFIAQAKTAIGKVIEVDRERRGGKYKYSPTISYTTVDGKRFTFDAEYGPSYYEVGQQVEVYYQVQNPSEAEIKGFLSQWMVVLGTGLTGLIVTVFGGARLYTETKKEKLQQWLQLHGKKITTTLQSVKQNNSARVHGQSPFIIYTQWLNPQTHQMHVFKSEPIWYDPTEFIPQSIDVIVDPQNYKRYQMDLSSLSKLYSSFQHE